jgi:hypothetical protein
MRMRRTADLHPELFGRAGEREREWSSGVVDQSGVGGLVPQRVQKQSRDREFEEWRERAGGVKQSQRDRVRTPEVEHRGRSFGT